MRWTVSVKGVLHNEHGVLLALNERLILAYPGELTRPGGAGIRASAEHAAVRFVAGGSWTGWPCPSGTGEQ